MNYIQGGPGASSGSESSSKQQPETGGTTMLETCYSGPVPLGPTIMTAGYMPRPLGVMSQPPSTQRPPDTVLVGNEVYTRASSSSSSSAQLQPAPSVLYMYHGYQPIFKPPSAKFEQQPPNMPMLYSNPHSQPQPHPQHPPPPNMGGVSYPFPVNSFQMPEPSFTSLELSKPLPEKPQMVDSKKRKAESTFRRKVSKCKNKGCNRNSRGKSGLCVSHGGGRRCKKCLVRSARPYSEYCSAHGGGQRCNHPNCTKGAVNKTNFCRRHRYVKLNDKPKTNSSSDTVDKS